MKSLEDLMQLMARLRGPGGCPWDREQTYATLAPMLVEEAYEVIEAAESAQATNDWGELRDEIGDLVFQLVFYAQIAAEEGHFTLPEALTRVHEKMTRRHPHVFGDEQAETAAEVLVNWEAIKAEERRQAGKTDDKPASLLDGVSAKIPALLESFQLTTKAARVGFDWEDVEDVFAKVEEEVGELRAEAEAGVPDSRAVAEEVGDLLFVVVNLARKLGVEPEFALKAANRKFRRRFAHVERRLGEHGKSFAESSLAEMDAFWDEAKEIERQN
jgi:MazG family protein